MFIVRSTSLMVLSFLATPLLAQDSPQRDAEAVAVVQRALSAMGGSSLTAITDVVASGTIVPADGSSAKSGSFTWKVSGDEFRREFRVGSSESVLVSGFGAPRILRDGKSRRFAYHVALTSPPLHLPGLVLYRQFANKGYSFKFLSTETIAGHPAVRIQTRLERNEVSKLVTVQEWFFDATTGLPLRVNYRIPDTKVASDYMEAAAEFSDFRLLSGFLVPFRMATYHEGQAWTFAQMSMVAANTGVNPDEFRGPEERQ